MDEDYGGSTSLSPCGICGRSFASERLAKHQVICQKSAQKKRKIFDSSKQRADGSDIPGPGKGGRQNVRTQPKPQQRQPQTQAQPKKSNWRQKHEEFISAIRNARGVQQAIDSGKPLPPPPPPTINPDYVQCPYCERRFNQTAAERHMPFCAEKNARLAANGPDATAKARSEARKQYKAPRLVKKSPTATSSVGAERYGTGSHGVNNRQSNSATTGGTNGSARSAASRGGGRGGTIKSYGSPSYGNDRTDSPGSGRALRTGRTTENYTEGRQFSAKQRTNDSMKGTGIGNSGYSGAPSPAGRSKYGNSNSSATSKGAAKFCHECGTKYPIPHAKFCCECGLKRVMVA